MNYDNIMNDIIQDFSRDELETIFIELSTQFEGFDKKEQVQLSKLNSTRKLATHCLDLIDEYGLPTRRSKLLQDFLFCAEYETESRNPKTKMHTVSAEEQNNILLELRDAGKINESITSLPPCYSTADTDNPGCKTCPFLKHCMDERIKTLPHCYGKMFQPFKNGDVNNPCYLCYESLFCRIEMEKRGGI